jgi:putative ABC transport system ATP-binding protein
VVITHNAVIRRIAHRVLAMADGRIVEETTNETRLRPAEVSW